MACPAFLTGLFGHLLFYLRDTSQDGCHLEVIPVGNGCHVAKGSHLVILGLDTTSIGDLRRREVGR
jgi:hypothetical protein